jgi:catalase
VGNRGPTTLENYQFLEKITHFDRERIPERVIHARGAGAQGTLKPAAQPEASRCPDTRGLNFFRKNGRRVAGGLKAESTMNGSGGPIGSTGTGAAVQQAEENAQMARPYWG